MRTIKLPGNNPDRPLPRLLCINCRHMAAFNGTPRVCTNDALREPVIGEALPCKVVRRLSVSEGGCGPNGVFFEQIGERS